MNPLTIEQADALQLRISAEGVFTGLEPQQLENLEKLGIYMEYQSELVTADGDTPGYFFYILKGDFEVAKADLDKNKKVILATISPGECFGEMSFLTGSPASANVSALRQVICWAVPHEALRGFIESQQGGANVAIQIAAILARRVQEGNTRLIGMNATLSAFFGNASRTAAPKTMDAPRAHEHAEMEIPEDVFEAFTRETLGLATDTVLNNAQKDEIRRKIEFNEVDIVPWLEQGQRGEPLKVRLKFEQASPRVSVSAAKVSATPTVSAPPTIVRVPQVRARMAPAVAYVPVKADPIWRYINIGSYCLLPFITIYILLALTPLDSRESMAATPGIRAMPMQSLVKLFLFRENAQSSGVMIKKGANLSLSMFIPKPVRLMARLELRERPSGPQKMRVKIGPEDEKAPRFFDGTVDVTTTGIVELCSVRIPPGACVLEVICEEGETTREIPANFVVVARR